MHASLCMPPWRNGPCAGTNDDGQRIAADGCLVFAFAIISGGVAGNGFRLESSYSYPTSDSRPGHHVLYCLVTLYVFADITSSRPPSACREKKNRCHLCSSGACNALMYPVSSDCKCLQRRRASLAVQNAQYSNKCSLPVDPCLFSSSVQLSPPTRLLEKLCDPKFTTTPPTPMSRVGQSNSLSEFYCVL